jgi:hypothetical protein
VNVERRRGARGQNRSRQAGSTLAEGDDLALDGSLGRSLGLAGGVGLEGKRGVLLDG